jgi:hypothetical protein
MKTQFTNNQRATRRLFLKSAFGAAAAPLILPSRIPIGSFADVTRPLKTAKLLALTKTRL